MGLGSGADTGGCTQGNIDRHPGCLYVTYATDRDCNPNGRLRTGLPSRPHCGGALAEAQMARTKKPVSPPVVANSSGLTVTGGAHSNNWISASGEAHGNGSFSASGGSFNGSGETHGSFSASGETHGLVSTASKSKRKGVGGKPRDPETALRDAKIVQDALDLRAQNPDRKKVKDKTIIRDVAVDHGVGDSYVRRKLAEHRKKVGTDPNHPHKPTTRDEFNATVKLGHYFINPADGKLYQRTKIAL
jgi:hypothetical protein